MDPKILEQIKNNLLSKKTELEAELKNMPTLVNDKGKIEAAFVDESSDEDSNAQETREYAENLSIVAELSKQLDDVNKALEKIGQGKYGLCKYCHKEIDPQRLLVRPDSGSCVDCKATLQGEKV